MNKVFEGVLGGVLANLHPEQILGDVLHAATGAIAGPVWLRIFKGMDVGARKDLGEKFQKLGGHLIANELNKASTVAADITDDVKLR